MLNFEFLDARHGDCFLVRWGASRVMLVDGGPGDTYDSRLKPHLETLPAGSTGQRVLDVVCVTHVDEDHITGVLRLLIETRRATRDPQGAPMCIRRFWFNSVEELVEQTAPGLFASVQSIITGTGGKVLAASINQGRELRNNAKGLGLEGNAPFNKHLVTGDQVHIDGLRVTVVAPDHAALDALATKWKRAKEKADPSVITSAYSDRSVPNLSSLVLHLEYNKRTALLTGDARGDRVLAGLAATGLLTQAPMRVGLLKVPHHGSDHNVEAAFFSGIHADHYVISADGVAHHHPSEQTLRWLVQSREPGDHFVVHLTNEIPFAIETLNELQHDRAFDVVVRPSEVRGLSVWVHDH